MTIDRRTLLAASLAAVPGAAVAQSLAALPAPETIYLWPGRDGPGLMNAALAEVVENRSKDPASPDRAVSGVRQPRMDVYRPAQANGAAMLVMPGGGYTRLSSDNEGREQARWLSARGITVFVLTYRLPAEGWRDPANTPLADAQRAMRLIRANATRFGVDPARIGAMGFSAGGHLCADLATRFGRAVYAPIDTADRLSARPTIAAPIYPVVSMEEDLAHAGSRAKLIGAQATDTMVIEHSPDQQVTKDTPPLFLVHAEDDATVKVANSIALDAAARAAVVPVEMHLFEKGGHGFGWSRRTTGLPVHLWPELFAGWAKGRLLTA
ncbi:alpha/beta hydrolase [uncultured Sphingomonas sp.]|uniref:alpha/beta hydrolase n=1 Tax=uncultured Sphingomonas sp. TaxID=158754 RepID=UPI0025E132F7|nr:alpha/beta hydrolase [uncultured Sphingomonas sp.]